MSGENEETKPEVSEASKEPATPHNARLRIMSNVAFALLELAKCEELSKSLDNPDIKKDYRRAQTRLVFNLKRALDLAEKL